MDNISADRGDEALVAVMRLEVALLDPLVRADQQQLDAILHQDFVEHGASGRIWTRQEILDELPLEDHNTPPTTASDVVAAWIDDDTILVTYRTTSALTCAVRSSTWLRTAAGQWRMRFHQGTPTRDTDSSPK